VSEREELLQVWRKARVAKPLRAFANFLIVKDNEDVNAISHICAISEDKEQGFADFMALRASEIKSPYHNPYFRVRGDSELMLVRLLIPVMRAWDFKTGKKVITS